MEETVNEVIELLETGIRETALVHEVLQLLQYVALLKTLKPNKTTCSFNRTPSHLAGGSRAVAFHKKATSCGPGRDTSPAGFTSGLGVIFFYSGGDKLTDCRRRLVLAPSPRFEGASRLEERR